MKSALPMLKPQKEIFHEFYKCIAIKLKGWISNEISIMSIQ